MKDIVKKLIIIPAYNEEANLGKVIDGIHATDLVIDIVVIDDGSSDRTAEIARSKGIKVIRLPFNQGYGAALQTGYIYARKNNYNIVVQMDADGQHDPHYIKDLIAAIEKGGTDLALGSRYLQKGKGNSSFSRRVGSRIFGWIASLLTGQKITDPTSGFQALNAQVVAFFSRTPFPSDYPDADIIILLHQAGFRLRELPVRMYSSANKISMHRGYLIIYYFIKMLISILVTMVRKNPKREA